jgi:hypothetical protein
MRVKTRSCRADRYFHAFLAALCELLHFVKIVFFTFLISVRYRAYPKNVLFCLSEGDVIISLPIFDIICEFLKFTKMCNLRIIALLLLFLYVIAVL